MKHSHYRTGGCPIVACGIRHAASRIAACCLIITAFATINAAEKTGGLQLAAQGKTDYVIVIGQQSLSAERTAAGQLQSYLKKITGADFEIVPENMATNTHRISLGQSQLNLKLLGWTNFAVLRPDEIVIRTLGKDLILTGAAPRGTLYAVFSFLEDQLGVRFWTPTEEFIPTLPVLKINALNIAYAPPFAYREVHYLQPNTDAPFAVKLRSNGHMVTAAENWGGHYSILGWCHTFGSLISAQRYFATHPEWFAQIKGVRVPDKQLCLASAQMREELTRNALARLAENPQAGYISISQNDSYPNESFCECAQCAALDAAEGSHSASVIKFVNAVAAEIEKKYPDTLVETLAYHYSLTPPATLRPRQNVVIRFAYADLDAARPLPAEFRKYLAGWSKISDRLFGWYYTANFYNYLVPSPNLLVLAEDIRTFRDNHTIGMFVQGDGYTTIGDFIRLRQWLTGKLLWNPDLDANQCIEEFLRGYYGAAAPYLREYLNLIRESALASGQKIEIFNSNTDWLTNEALRNAYRAFENARKAVKENPVLLGRVERERIPLLMVLLSRANKLDQNGVSESPQQMARSIIDIARANHNTSYGENKDFSALAGRLERQFGLVGRQHVPALCQQLSPEDWIDFPNSDFDIAAPWGGRQPDAASSFPQVAYCNGDNMQWAIQVRGNSAYSGGNPYRFYMVMRSDGPATAGIAASAGLYDSNRKAAGVSKDILVGQIRGNSYRVVEIGTGQVSDDMIFYVAGPNRPKEVEHVYIERIFAIKESVAAKQKPVHSTP